MSRVKERGGGDMSQRKGEREIVREGMPEPRVRKRVSKRGGRHDPRVWGESE